MYTLISYKLYAGSVSLVVVAVYWVGEMDEITWGYVLFVRVC